MKHYHINAFYSEDDGYIADIPDFQHCSAFGATPEEASQEVLKAKQAWLEAARASGKPIPAPRYRPVIDQAVRGTPQKQPQRSNTLGRPPRLCRAASHPVLERMAHSARFVAMRVAVSVGRRSPQPFGCRTVFSTGKCGRMKP